MRLEELDTAIHALERSCSGEPLTSDEAHAPARTQDRPESHVTIALDNLRLARGEVARLQDALAEERSRNRAVFESAWDPSITLSDTGRIIAVNDPALKLLGYEREELVGERIDVLIPERFHEAHARAHASAMRAPRERAMGVEMDLCARHRDGHEIAIEISLLPHKLRSGIGTVGIIHDISVKVLAAAEVARQRDMLRLVSDSLPVLIAYVDRDLNYVFANRLFREWFGIAPGDVIDGTMRTVLGTRVFAQVEPFVERVLAGEAVSFERSTRHADGSPAVLQVSYVPDAGPCADTCGFFVLANDVTEHKKAEAVSREMSVELSHRVVELEALLDIVPVGVAIADDPECLRIRPNSELRRMLRLAPGTNASSSAPTDERPTHFTMTRNGVPIPDTELPMQVSARTGRPVQDAQMAAVFDNGSITSIYGHATPLFDADGNVRGAIGAFHDITDMRRVEDELRKANAVKDEFLGLISHELKTPITTILGNAEVLLNRASALDESERVGALSDIHDEASRLHAIIDNLLVLARIEGGQRIEREPVLLQRLVANAVHLHVRRNPHRSVNVRCDEALPPASAAVTYVEQVLSNLLSNAEKYSPPDAPIGVEVRVVEAGKHVSVSVCDEGVGIPAEELDHVFTAFYRLPRTAERAPGFGIGLTVCKRLIEAQDGRIWAERRAEGGTRFTFTLPVANEDADDHEA